MRSPAQDEFIECNPDKCKSLLFIAIDPNRKITAKLAIEAIALPNDPHSHSRSVSTYIYLYLYLYLGLYLYLYLLRRCG